MHSHAGFMKSLVLGANGRTGRQFIDQALAAGDHVTALVRSADRLSDLQHPRLEVRVGNPCDPEFLASVMSGHDVVVSALGPRVPTKFAAAIYSDSASAILHAMQQTGVTRLLVTSSALLFPDQDLFGRVMKLAVPPIVNAAGRMEALIQDSNLEWTIARTGFLTDGQADTFQTSDRKGGTVSRAGVAHFLRSEAVNGQHIREVVGLSA